MGTIAQKKAAALASKTAIKTAIEGKGVTVGAAPLAQYAALIDSIANTGGTVDTTTLNYKTGGIYREEWPDIQAILEADSYQAANKLIILFRNSDYSFAPTAAFFTTDLCTRILLSDGAVMTAAGTHTWDRAQDIVASDGLKYRWAIFYFSASSTPAGNIATASIPIWQHMKVNLSGVNMFDSKRALVGVTFATGYRNLTSGANATLFFNGCTSLTYQDADCHPVGATSANYWFVNAKVDKLVFPDMAALTTITNYLVYSQSVKEIVGVMDFGAVTSQNAGPFYQCYALVEVRIKNLGLSLSITTATSLSYDSLMYLINNLKTVTAQTLSLGTNINKLTAGEIAIATGKGWTVA